MTFIFLLFFLAVYSGKKTFERVDYITLFVGAGLTGIFDVYVWIRWIFYA